MSDAVALENLSTLLRSRPASSVVGWKVAINAAGAQRKLGLSHAIAAPLDGKSVYQSGAQLSFDAGANPYVEVELALTLGADITVVPSLEELRRMVSSYTPCLELVDYALPKTDLATMLSHSFFHAGIVFGTPLAADSFVPLAGDYPRLTSGGRTLRTRSEGAVHDDVVVTLLELVRWVVAAGAVLRTGQVVLCGSYVEPLPLPRGAQLEADFGAPWQPLAASRG